MTWFRSWFRRHDPKPDYQREQITRSLTSVSQENTRRLDIVEADMSRAVEGAIASIDRRGERAGPLREALEKLIERQSRGRFAHKAERF